MTKKIQNTLRLPPEHPLGIKRVQVGCGPHNLLQDWWNLDIRHFKGVDQVMDVTEPWPWNALLDFVYGEHFIEHLDLSQAILFLGHAIRALKPGAKIRLSTPSLEWVLATHFELDSKNERDRRITQSLAMNRAFHGWGHKFLYSRHFFEELLTALGFVETKFYPYGISDEPGLSNLERHGGYQITKGFPSVWIVESKRPQLIQINGEFIKRCQDEYINHVDSGH